MLGYILKHLYFYSFIIVKPHHFQQFTPGIYIYYNGLILFDVRQCLAMTVFTQQ